MSTHENSESKKDPYFELTNSTDVNKISSLYKHPHAPHMIAPVLLFVAGAIYAYLVLDSNVGLFDLAGQHVSLVLKTAVVFCLLSIGAALVLSAGQIDISSLGVATLSGTLFAIVSNNTVAYPWVGTLIATTLSIMIGIASGVIVSISFKRLRAPLLILTWALGSIYGILSICIASTVHGMPSGVRLSKSMPQNFWQEGQSGFILILLVIFISCLYIYWSKLAVRAKAIGASEAGANFAGVPILKTYYEVFIMNGVLGALAGIFNCLQLNTASTGDLFGKELIPIAIAVLGGTFLSGGYLMVSSVVIASLFWAVIRLISPWLPKYVPALSFLQAELGQLLFFLIFVIISLSAGRMLGPPLSKVFANQEN